jgi:transposase-like protein
VAGLDLMLDPERQPRRFEVINGAGGRRHWSMDDKARIVAETLEPNAMISEVAREHRLRPFRISLRTMEGRRGIGRERTGATAAKSSGDDIELAPATITRVDRPHWGKGI